MENSVDQDIYFVLPSASLGRNLECYLLSVVAATCLLAFHMSPLDGKHSNLVQYYSHLGSFEKVVSWAQPWRRRIQAAYILKNSFILLDQSSRPHQMSTCNSKSSSFWHINAQLQWTELLSKSISKPPNLLFIFITIVWNFAFWWNNQNQPFQNPPLTERWSWFKDFWDSTTIE